MLVMNDALSGGVLAIGFLGEAAEPEVLGGMTLYSIRVRRFAISSEIMCPPWCFWDVLMFPRYLAKPSGPERVSPVVMVVAVAPSKPVPETTPSVNCDTRY